MIADNTWPSFASQLKNHNLRLERTNLATLQVNIGKLCNQTCLHCHVEAGPHKTRENMSQETVEHLLTLLRKSPQIKCIDITGGAPELNINFRHLVSESRRLGLTVIDRCNLTVLFEPGQEDTAVFLAEQKVKIVASMPCYSRKNVENQRGDGVFGKSIRALKNLNELGYGSSNSGLELDLVYNPNGAFLPPAQSELESEFKAHLLEDFGIRFNRLYAITNMPIKRFLYDLKKNKSYDTYMSLLSENFNPNAVDSLMCRNLVSISWDGKIFDCDFNQMLSIDTGCSQKNIWQIESFADLIDTNINIGDHCLGCTAGAGSSCQGSIV